VLVLLPDERRGPLSEEEPDDDDESEAFDESDPFDGLEDSVELGEEEDSPAVAGWSDFDGSAFADESESDDAPSATALRLSLR
jgi:hypothetical protein